MSIMVSLILNLLMTLTICCVYNVSIPEYLSQLASGGKSVIIKNIHTIFITLYLIKSESCTSHEQVHIVTEQ